MTHVDQAHIEHRLHVAKVLVAHTGATWTGLTLEARDEMLDIANKAILATRETLRVSHRNNIRSE